jgi:anti-sigma factor RsiW
MNCQETQKLLDAYLDGELDLLKSLELELHFNECQTCSRAYQNRRTLQKAINEGPFYYDAPSNMKRRVLSALGKTEERTAQPLIWIWGWQGAAVGMAGVAMIVFAIASLWKGPSADDLLAQEILSSHVRSLMADHLTDVPSTDQHTVKPWFDGKLDFSPQVTDLTTRGFALIGGRLDYLQNRPVAALVYQRRKHFINLYVWPSGAGTNVGENPVTRQGYNLVHWTKSDMTYWAVSDVNMSDLDEFERVLQNP